MVRAVVRRGAGGNTEVIRFEPPNLIRPEERVTMKDRAPDCREPRSSGPLRAKLRRATALIIAVRRKLGKGGEELRADILADIKDALVGDGPSVELIEIPGEPSPRSVSPTRGSTGPSSRSSASIARTPMSRNPSGRGSGGTSTRRSAGMLGMGRVDGQRRRPREHDRNRGRPVTSSLSSQPSRLISS